MDILVNQAYLPNAVISSINICLIGKVPCFGSLPIFQTLNKYKNMLQETKDSFAYNHGLNPFKDL